MSLKTELKEFLRMYCLKEPSSLDLKTPIYDFYKEFVYWADFRKNKIGVSNLFPIKEADITEELRKMGYIVLDKYYQGLYVINSDRHIIPEFIIKEIIHRNSKNEN
jgi:hypothetical protein